MFTVTREDCHGNHERLKKSFGLIVMKLHMNFFGMSSCAFMIKYFKMATVAMIITMKVKKSFYPIVMKLHRMILGMWRCAFKVNKYYYYFIISPLPEVGGGILFYVCPSVLPSVQDIFRHIFLSNYWWQKSDIWSQTSYRYPISWEAFFDQISDFCHQ